MSVHELDPREESMKGGFHCLTCNTFLSLELCVCVCVWRVGGSCNGRSFLVDFACGPDAPMITVHTLGVILFMNVSLSFKSGFMISCKVISGQQDFLHFCSNGLFFISLPSLNVGYPVIAVIIRGFWEG